MIRSRLFSFALGIVAASIVAASSLVLAVSPAIMVAAVSIGFFAPMVAAELTVFRLRQDFRLADLLTAPLAALARLFPAPQTGTPQATAAA